MPKRSLSVSRFISICLLVVIAAYLSAIFYHYYWLNRWKIDTVDGGAYLHSQQYDKAIVSLQDALRVSPRLGQNYYVHANARTHEQLGEAYQQKGQFGLAAAEYRAAIGIDSLSTSQDGLKSALAHDKSQPVTTHNMP